MKQERVLFVGGTFNEEEGRASGLVSKIAEAVKNYLKEYDVHTINGGNTKMLPLLLNQVIDYDYVFWWANVLGDVEKIRDVKKINPRCILIGSKRNNNEYTFGECVSRALEQKHNLCVEFTKIDSKYQMGLFDPLGNLFYKGTDINELVKVLCDRMIFLKSITRQGTIKSDIEIDKPEIDSLFLELIKGYAETFHELIQAQTTRFLGNCSTRCMRGFPSFREGELVYVSRRNVDKRYIDENAFVPCYFDEGKIKYIGENKPSVDTPIQLRLYKELPNINYMVHAHCYVKDAPFTDKIIPCGGIEEVDEMLKLIDKDTKFCCINLLGHGSTVLASSVEQLKDIPYYGRILPENHCEEK